jgi:two-component system response regulator
MRNYRGELYFRYLNTLTMKRSILMLEHDDDDRYITQAVFDENNYPVQIHFVDNSNDLFAFLISCEKKLVPFPSLILLNHYASPLNAVDILRDLKSDSRFSHIPVVVLSGTTSHDIIRRCYAMGATSFIRKPSSGAQINEKISTFVRYWFGTVELP